MNSSDLPTGTITFLLTDIEGSTVLWETAPSEMGIALGRHDQLIHEIVEGNGGNLPRSQGEGDSVLAAFRIATDAVAAAVDIQRAFIAESWPTPTPLRVRIALHTGEAELRGEDYFGLTVNRCARIRAIAHGGQTILSQATAELVRDRLPEGAYLQDFGLHRLKDIAEAEHIFQLCHPQLASDFPPLRSLETLTHNLPIRLTSFVGRDREMSDITKLLTTTRLLTLTGEGGTGKTRLALEVADVVLDSYSDGVRLVELASLSQPGLVPHTVAAEFRVREAPGRQLIETLIEHLRFKRLLLILDNCEHLADACAKLAELLLRACPNLTILATSRETLGASGETVWLVPPLSLPAGNDPEDLEALAHYDSSRLFLDRARLARPDFSQSADAAALAKICRRLDGIPLAIELAAARVTTLSLEEIHRRLEKDFRLLVGGSRTAPDRHKTLTAVVEWSHNLLNDFERVVFRRLSVFKGSFALEAAEEICSAGEIDKVEILDLLSRLVDKSLVVAASTNVWTRYLMHESVRQYAEGKLSESGEEETLRTRHLKWFLSLSEEARDKLYAPDQVEWLDRLDEEHDNFRAALEWSARAGLTDAELRLGGALSVFWFLRGHWTEGRSRLNGILSSGTDSTTPFFTRALNGTGTLAHAQRDYVSARTFYEEALTIERESGDAPGIIESLVNLGNLELTIRNWTEANLLLREALEMARGLKDKRGIARSLLNLGTVEASQGDQAEARSLLAEGLAVARDLGDQHLVAGALIGLGSVAVGLDDFEEARSRYDEALDAARKLEHKMIIIHALLGLAGVATSQGDHDAAESLLSENLSLSREFGEREALAESLHGLGVIALAQGDLDRAYGQLVEALRARQEIGEKHGICNSLEKLAEAAALRDQHLHSSRLLGAAEALREALDHPIHSRHRDGYEKTVAAAREGLDEDSFLEAWTEGRTMTLDQAIAFAVGKALD